MSDNPQNPQDAMLLYVAPQEPPPSRRPPVLTVGPVGWLRVNLFATPLNSVLTVITGLFLLWAVGSTLTWALFDAEWTVVNNNLRLLMVGQYDTDQLWRVNLLALVLAGLAGLSIGIWAKVPRWIMMTLVLVVLVGLAIPPLSRGFEPPAIYYLVPPTDEAEVPPMRFVGDEGQTIRLSVERLTVEAVEAGADRFAGFIENTPGLSNSRSIWNQVKQRVTTDQTDLSDYTLDFQVHVRNAQGEILTTLDSPPDDPNATLSYALPETGWYVLAIQRADDSDAGYAWLRLNNIASYTTRPQDIQAREQRYGPPPVNVGCAEETEDGCQRDVAERNLRFDGSRNLGDYFRVQLAPFLSEVMLPVAAGLAVATVAGLLGRGLLRVSPTLKKWSPRLVLLAWLLYLPASYLLLQGFQGSEAVPYVPTNAWGGLMLTLILTAVAIVASFPIGILLALGRWSNLGIISLACTIFIEVVRGVPLITILFFAKLILPFFISDAADIEQAVRMMVGLTLFTAAYVAEVVRGGLQIVGKGQVEAAQAVGLNTVQTTYYIVLPQALRAVIPAVMSQFVSLFKDTTLVSIVGLFELLGIVEFIINGQQQYRSFVREAYLFVLLVYFFISLVMSTISRRLEQTGVGATNRMSL